MHTPVGTQSPNTVQWGGVCLGCMSRTRDRVGLRVRGAPICVALATDACLEWRDESAIECEIRSVMKGVVAKQQIGG